MNFGVINAKVEKLGQTCNVMIKLWDIKWLIDENFYN